jgi:hypothetical protein
MIKSPWLTRHIEYFDPDSGIRVCDQGLHIFFDFQSPSIQFRFFDEPGDDRIRIRRNGRVSIVVGNLFVTRLFECAANWLYDNVLIEDDKTYYVELWYEQDVKAKVFYA